MECYGVLYGAWGEGQLPRMGVGKRVLDSEEDRLNTIEQPTVEQVESFCDAMKAQLVEAVKRGSQVTLGYKTKWRELFMPEYGRSPVDLIHVGMVFKIEFKENV